MSATIARECQELCVRDFCEGGFWFAYIEHKALLIEARLTTLLGRSERSSPKAALRCAAGAGLDGEGASQAIIAVFSSSRCSQKTLAELNGELTHGGGPFDPPPPAHTGVLDGEVKQL